MNNITVYKGNTRAVICTVTGLVDLIGYTATLKLKKAANDTDIIFSSVGSINALVITFDISAGSNSQEAGQYVYEVTITDGTNIYSVTQDKYTILESAALADTYLVTVTVTDGIPTYYGQYIYVTELDLQVACSVVGVATFYAVNGTYNILGSNDTENLVGRAADVVVNDAPMPSVTITIA